MKRPQRRATKAELCLQIRSREMTSKPMREDVVRDLKLTQRLILQAMLQPGAPASAVTDFAEAAMTWAEMARVLYAKHRTDELLAAKEAMERQLEASESALERLRRTGKAGLSGPELMAARQAAEWADAMAEVCDQATATTAAIVSTQWAMAARREAAAA